MKVVEGHGGVISGITLNKSEEQQNPEEQKDQEEQKNPEESQEGWILLQDGDAPPGSEAQKPQIEQPEEKKPEEKKPEEKKVEEQKPEEQKPEAPKAPEETEVPSPLHAKIEAKGWGWHS
jgi:outer membrane biosynthesis protein TonB